MKAHAIWKGPKKENYILPKNVKYDQDNILKARPKWILYLISKEAVTPPQVVSIAREIAIK